MTAIGSRTALSAAAALVCLGLLGPTPASGSQAQLDGEYGLWATDSGGTVGVGWLTSVAQEGFLEVISEGSTGYRIETPPRQAHFTTFPRPSGDMARLRYGALSAEDVHETVLYLNQEEERAPAVITGVDSLFVVGDVHGEFDRVVVLLGNAGLIDAESRWIGGERHVVFLGDIFDRGYDVTRVLWFLYEL